MKCAARLALAAAAWLLLSTGPAEAKIQAIGPLTSSATTFGNTFAGQTSSFIDYYTFNISGAPRTLQGGVNDSSFEFQVSRNVTVSSLLLLPMAGGKLYDYDLTPDAFTFYNLGPGSYKLVVIGSVGSGAGEGWYQGTISSIASAAPEPAYLALTAVGLLGVAGLTRAGRRTG
jgi:hypothetical protein